MSIPVSQKQKSIRRNQASVADLTLDFVRPKWLLLKIKTGKQDIVETLAGDSFGMQAPASPKPATVGFKLGKMQDRRCLGFWYDIPNKAFVL